MFFPGSRSEFLGRYKRPIYALLKSLARPNRFELLTPRFVVSVLIIPQGCPSLGDAIREGETVGIPYEVRRFSGFRACLAFGFVASTIIGPHAAAALRLLIFTGARLREILGLRWEWVDLAGALPRRCRRIGRR
jgi:integrase